MTVADISIEVTASPAAVDRDQVLAGLVAHNRTFLGRNDSLPLAVLARYRGQPAGGLLGETTRGFFFIELFWLTPELRRQGLGRLVLASGEAEAHRRRCHTAWLDTFDFQAPSFYARQGYRIFGELAGYPNGHRRYFLSKPLSASSGGP